MWGLGFRARFGDSWCACDRTFWVALLNASKHLHKLLELLATYEGEAGEHHEGASK